LGTKIGGFLPFVDQMLKVAQSDYPGLPWNCPMQPGNYSSYHIYDWTNNTVATRVNISQITTEKPSNQPAYYYLPNGLKMLNLKLPNGIYRSGINFTTKNNTQGFQYSCQSEIRSRLGVNEF
jgi:hypothetical protein